MCINNIFQGADDYLKKKITTYKSYKYESKNINDFSQSQKLGLIQR